MWPLFAYFMSQVYQVDESGGERCLLVDKWIIINFGKQVAMCLKPLVQPSFRHFILKL